MLHLLQNTQNSVNVTVSNESELTNPTYLWCLTHLESRKKVYFIPPNISVPHSLRFDTFTFNSDENSPQVFTGNTCNIHLAQGQYSYAIYDQVSTTNLNPLYANSVVENGLAWVQQTEVCFTTYEYTNPNAEAVIYYNPGTCPPVPPETSGKTWNNVAKYWDETTEMWMENIN